MTDEISQLSKQIAQLEDSVTEFRRQELVLCKESARLKELLEETRLSNRNAARVISSLQHRMAELESQCEDAELSAETHREVKRRLVQQLAHSEDAQATLLMEGDELARSIAQLIGAVSDLLGGKVFSYGEFSDVCEVGVYRVCKHLRNRITNAAQLRTSGTALEVDEVSALQRDFVRSVSALRRESLRRPELSDLSWKLTGVMEGFEDSDEFAHSGKAVMDTPREARVELHLEASGIDEDYFNVSTLDLGASPIAGIR